MGIQKLPTSWQLLTKQPKDPSGYELTPIGATSIPKFNYLFVHIRQIQHKPLISEE